MYLSDRVQRRDKTEQILPMIVILPIIENDYVIFSSISFSSFIISLLIFLAKKIKVHRKQKYFLIRIVFIGTLS